ncbi:hypothetical protein QUA13_00970 [Microcoleus sp. S28C3]|jgi:hypothetical protein|uniref:hypothetical protein n=1 Tax=unclassified Microcoleus TaxID=2642155 RepID=UPI002FCF6296
MLLAFCAQPTANSVNFRQSPSRSTQFWHARHWRALPKLYCNCTLAEPTPAVLFSGNFQYEIAGELEGEKLHHLYELLENWQPDLEAYREIVIKRFLGQETEELPAAA